MRLSRRQFNRGAAMLTGAAAMPPVPVSVKPGSDDAYEAIVSELVRAEEAAHAAGAAQQGGGAVSAVGRQLEGFIGHLDLQVSPLESSAQVYRELRGFLKEESRKIANKALEKAEAAVKSTASSKGSDENEADIDEMTGVASSGDADTPAKKS